MRVCLARERQLGVRSAGHRQSLSHSKPDRVKAPKTDWRIHLEARASGVGFLEEHTRQETTWYVCFSVWCVRVRVCRCFFLCYTHILSVVWVGWGHLSGDCLILWPCLFNGSQSGLCISCQDSSLYWLLWDFSRKSLYCQMWHFNIVGYYFFLFFFL